MLAAGLCLVAILAAVRPGATSLEFLVVPLAWEPAPDEPTRTIAPPVTDAAAQPLSLHSLAASRAPPAIDVA